MRKLFWCCTAAGLLVVGGMASISYYASCHPATTVARCVLTAAGSSFIWQPVAGIGSMVSTTVHTALKPRTCTPHTGPAHDCIPADPRPIEPQPAAGVGVVPMELEEPAPAAAPIVIQEEEWKEGPAVPAPVDLKGAQEPAADEPCQDHPEQSCPMVMPYCADDDDETPVPSTMPEAGDDEDQPAGGCADSKKSIFAPWKKLFKAAPKEDKPASESSEAIGPETTPNCQEDSHYHDHYSGCPYTGRCRPSKSGKEEVSEEPLPMPKRDGKKPHGKNKCPKTEGVDTMEYRRSDGGLNEYGPGPF